ncbi:YqcC family protein [Thalassotalea euphylliae]|uniref:YqcC family protein n=1 Tax=Thalassotalea euphylliae TaxID=1655234 RepID=A0A3E0U6N0_9GAMM|nr:YqcC family protein [Thalassotalea euphylliae]REL32384.1 YqcC family protein [Thalassotalea euphylliae]
MTSQQHSIDELLYQLEQEMRHLKLWSIVKPRVEKLMSAAPFCVDTLRFEQWLQYIFLPQMYQLIKNKQPLPTQIALCPMAEVAFVGLSDKAADLINIIGDIDELLSGQRQQQKFLRNE